MDLQKFVLRLLDRDGTLLAWAPVAAQPFPQERGASCPFWPITGRQTLVPVDTTGTVAEVTVHWTALDVARRTAVEPLDVIAGQALTFTWLEPVWLVPGMRDVPLPAVTERGSITTEVPPGTLIGAP